ncbi:MAG: endonuclease III [Myxococcales bacterium]|nr:MAG: endonuclease III [Myxococcales bacterium]
MPAKRAAPARRTPDPSFPIHDVMAILADETRRLRQPIVTEQAQKRRDPFRVLISTMISLRTKDEVTAEASRRLYALADTPEAMQRLPEDKIAKAIYPAGFYKTKAAHIKAVCRLLVENFGSRVPEEIDVLTTFPGVGRKTANLVRTLGYGLPGICVDTHVHRIANRWGYVKTKTPEETETRLREILPAEYWIPINDYLVAWGQNVCAPISPHCSRCPLALHCRKIGVDRSR